MIVFTITIEMIIRSSHQRYSVRKGVLRNFAKIHRKTPVPDSFLNKVVGLWAVILLKRL